MARTPFTSTVGRSARIILAVVHVGALASMLTVGLQVSAALGRPSAAPPDCHNDGCVSGALAYDLFGTVLGYVAAGVVGISACASLIALVGLAVAARRTKLAVACLPTGGAWWFVFGMVLVCLAMVTRLKLPAYDLGSLAAIGVAGATWGMQARLRR